MNGNRKEVVNDTLILGVLIGREGAVVESRMNDRESDIMRFIRRQKGGGYVI